MELLEYRPRIIGQITPTKLKPMMAMVSVFTKPMVSRRGPGLPLLRPGETQHRASECLFFGRIGLKIALR